MRRSRRGHVEDKKGGQNKDIMRGGDEEGKSRRGHEDDKKIGRHMGKGGNEDTRRT